MIRGERVVLRAIESGDLERCHQWMNDPEVKRFLSMRFPISMVQEKQWVEGERDPNKELHLAIEALEGEHIGNCGLMNRDTISRHAELGIVIGNKEYWSKGYGTDAMLTLCGFGFTQMNLHRICLRVLDVNARGIRCYEKCGFQHEGRLREAEFKHGAYHDMLLMSILADEFREQWPERWPTGAGEQ